MTGNQMAASVEVKVGKSVVGSKGCKGKLKSKGGHPRLITGQQCQDGAGRRAG